MGGKQVGERTSVGVQNGTCPQDCPIAYTLCPSTDVGLCGAKGRCYSDSGTCDCFAGWASASSPLHLFTAMSVP